MLGYLTYEQNNIYILDLFTIYLYIFSINYVYLSDQKEVSPYGYSRSSNLTNILNI